MKLKITYACFNQIKPICLSEQLLESVQSFSRFL